MLAAAGASSPFAALAQTKAASRVPTLKIKEIRAVRLRGTGSRFVRVYTDKGLMGTGETLDTIGGEDIINKTLSPGIAGRDPLDIEGIWFDLFTWRAGRVIPPLFARGMGGPYLAAVSGVEMALWDLAGKAMDVPLYRLLGGRVREKVAMYLHAYTPEQAAEAVKTTGVKALKAVRLDAGTDTENAEQGFDPGKSFGWTLTNKQIDAFAARVAALRKAVGEEVGLGLECHARYDVESAIQLAKAVEPSRPMWLEEPVPSDNVEAMAKVREATRIPIACGENVYTRYGFRPFIEKQAASILQPDMAKCGGLLETRKIASMAEVYSIPIAPHGVATMVGQMAYAHVCATVPNFMALEWMHYFNKNVMALAAGGEFKGGMLTVSNGPGIGVEVDEGAVKAALVEGYEL
jgi:galactonate dehydratase